MHVKPCVCMLRDLFWAKETYAAHTYVAVQIGSGSGSSVHMELFLFTILS